MNSKINIAIANFLAFTAVLNPTPALAVFSESMNFLISGAVYLRRPSWENFQLTTSPNRLGIEDKIRGQEGVEAVVLCSDFSRYSVSSEQEFDVSLVCPPRSSNRRIPSPNGDMLPTSDNEVESEKRPLRTTDLLTVEEMQAEANPAIPEIEEIDLALEKLNEIEMAESARAFVTAHIYISQGLLPEAISSLELALSPNVITPEFRFRHIANYQLLGILYEETEQYDSARSLYKATLSYIEGAERQIRAIVERQTIERAGGPFDSVVGVESSIPRTHQGSEPVDLFIENRADTLFSVGNLFLESGDYREAVDSLNSSKELYLELEGENSPTAQAIEIEPLERILVEAEAEASQLQQELTTAESQRRESIIDTINGAVDVFEPSFILE